MLKVLYDGQCGLCSREIRFYQKIGKTVPIEWLDVNKSDDILKAYNLDYFECLKSLHSIENNKIIKGVDSFVLIWQNIKPLRIFAFTIKLPIIYQITKWAYKIFAQWRFNRNQVCKIN